MWFGIGVRGLNGKGWDQELEIEPACFLGS